MNLPRLRKQIDRLDDRLVQLLHQRIRRVEQVAALKAKNGDRIYDPRRERELLERLSRKKGPLSRKKLGEIYRVIFRASREHQRRLIRKK